MEEESVSWPMCDLKIQPYNVDSFQEPEKACLQKEYSPAHSLISDE